MSLAMGGLPGEAATDVRRIWWVGSPARCGKAACGESTQTKAGRALTRPWASDGYMTGRYTDSAPAPTIRDKGK